MTNDIELAEKLTKRRARMMPALAIIFLTQQAAYFSGPVIQSSAAAHFKIAAWLVLSCVLLLLLATGGSFFRPAQVRALVNDETTKAHRAQALTLGFWAAMVTCIVIYGISFYESLDARAAVHLVMSLGIGAALLRFAVLERRALK